MGHLNLIFDNMEDFYQQALTQESTGNSKMFDDFQKEDREDFVGLSKQEIQKCKYSYPKGLEKLKELERDIDIVAGSDFVYRWDEIDGEDMNMERLYEGMPSLRKRIRSDGFKHGRFINLYVNICENGWVDANDILYKCLASTAIADYLENKGYRVAIYSVSASTHAGKYKGSPIDSDYTEVKIKDYNEPIIKPNLITALSPWFFRYWMFSLWSAKFATSGGLGQSARIDKKSNHQNIYIDQGECLNKKDTLKKIDEVNKLFK